MSQYGLLVSYSSGILAAVSPCVVVLIPLVLIRFSGDLRSKNGQADKSRARHLSEVATFAVGFLSSYLVFGYAISSVLTSSVQNGVRAGLGAFFAIAGTLSIVDRLDPLNMPVADSAFLTGVSFSLLVSLNPCTVPFLAVIISLSTTDALLSLLCFGMGLLTPALLFTLAGRSALAGFRKAGGALHLVNKAMSSVLVVAGVYLIASTAVLEIADVFVAGALVFLAGVVAVNAFGGLTQLTGWRVVVWACLLLALFGFTGTCALSYEHRTKTHELLSPASLTAQAGGEGSGQCVDVSRVPPCDACRSCIPALVAQAVLICGGVLLTEYRLRHGASALPVLSPTATSARRRRWDHGPWMLVAAFVSAVVGVIDGVMRAVRGSHQRHVLRLQDKSLKAWST